MPIRGGWIPKLKEIVPGTSEIQETKVLVSVFSSFRVYHKIGSNLQVRTLILLKFDTLVGCIQANSGTNFGDNTA